MRHSTLLMMVCFALCIPTLLFAEKRDEKVKRDDSKYLAGAVPQDAEGRVVFTHQYDIPGMSQDVIFEKALAWMEARLEKNENISRVVFQDKQKGQIVGLGQEWIVFSSSALSLDRTEINYQLTVNCQPEKCRLEIEKIRYSYREGKEKYTAEEWITDEYALNKSKTKLVRGLAKWRRKTVDFTEDHINALTNAFNLTQAVATAPVQSAKSVPMTDLQPARKANALQEAAPAEVIKQFGNPGSGVWVVAVGEDSFNMTMMTANAGGSLGTLKDTPVAFTIFSPDQTVTAIEKAQKYSVSFYPTDSKTPLFKLECEPMPAPTAIEGMPRTFIGRIVKAEMQSK